MSKRSAMQQRRSTTRHEPPRGAPSENVEWRLDEALAETFPASDPISVSIADQKAPVRKPLVRE